MEYAHLRTAGLQTRFFFFAVGRLGQRLFNQIFSGNDAGDAHA